MESVDALIDEIFNEAGIVSGTGDAERMTIALHTMGFNDDEVGRFFAQIRHPSTGGKMTIRAGNVTNYIMMHEDHFHVVGVPDELDIAL